MPLPLHTYAVIFSLHGYPEHGHLAHVQATCAGHARDVCNDATDDGGIWEGHDFTIWPHAIN